MNPHGSQVPDGGKAKRDKFINVIYLIKVIYFRSPLDNPIFYFIFVVFLFGQNWIKAKSKLEQLN